MEDLKLWPERICENSREFGWLMRNHIFNFANGKLQWWWNNSVEKLCERHSKEICNLIWKNFLQKRKKNRVVFVYIVVRSGWFTMCSMLWKCSERCIEWKYQCKIMERFICVWASVCWMYWIVREKTLQLQEAVCACAWNAMRTSQILWAFNFVVVEKS